MEKERREEKMKAGLAVRETEPNIIFGTVLGVGTEFYFRYFSKWKVGTEFQIRYSKSKYRN